MKLTSEQRQAVLYDDNTFIEACPGSGKTRTLVAKLLHCLEGVRNTSRKIACVTYTNAAVYEIEHRVREYGTCEDEDYCDVSTIHSFCLVNVLNRFYWRIPEYQNGFSVVTPDSEQYQTIASDVLAEHGQPRALMGHFENANRKPDGSPISSELDPAVLNDFWERLQMRGLIDFPNIIYFSYRLLAENPTLGYALSCRYMWFLVDEFQDTTELQVEIFRIIASFGQTKFFLVGDPYQSIFGFAGARVELMSAFATEISSNMSFRLLANYRSSNKIICHAECVFPRTPPMFGAGATADENIEPTYVHAVTAFEAVRDHFLPVIRTLDIPYGETAVIAPWWVKLWHIGRGLREIGVPVVGPGARPYRRSNLLAAVAEQVCAYIAQPSKKGFHRIERELFLLLNGITGKWSFSVFSFQGSITVRKLIKAGSDIYERHALACNWLREASRTFHDILKEDGFLSISTTNLLEQSAEEMVQDILKNKIDIRRLTTNELGLFASTERNMHLLTMHRAKGREFDAVAVIDLHEGRVPDFRAIRDADVERIEEDKRRLYVSITRARRFLMYVSDSEDYRNVPSRFLHRGCLNLV